MNKKMYEVPESELIFVRIEENILSGGIQDISGENVEDDSENWG